jgi:hypothetical protein
VDDVYICELCIRAYEPEEINGVRKLKKFHGYFVDLRLQQFRTTLYMFPELGNIQGIGIDFIDFASPKGKKLLAQMHEEVTR